MLTADSAASTLPEEEDACVELVLMLERVKSMLDDELESERDEVLFVAIEALTELSDASTLEEESERLLELPFRTPKSASRLDDDDDKLSEEV